MVIHETTPLTHERAWKAVRDFARQMGYQGEMIVLAPAIECGNKHGVWLVTVIWKKDDHRGNQLNQFIVFLVWGNEDGAVTILPYHQEGPCVEAKVTSFIYYPDHDGKIHIGYEIKRVKSDEIEPPWME